MPKYQLPSAAYHLSFNEIQKLLFHTTSFRNRCILKTFFWTGIRREELIKLNIEDIDFERKRITVTGKGGKTRTIPIINEEHLSDLKHLIGRRKKGPVFTGRYGKPFSLQAINYITKKSGEYAGITNPNPRFKNINPHIFRHSIARYLKSKGFSAEWLQNFLAHSYFKTTMDMYGAISINEMQEESDRRLTVI
jgi:integrase/recombinase XerD